ncbi:MAG: hypothetical protein HYV60_22815, partial [Planctomycetia bacterium]|nr:hypothetical protein [Planctomycetia bacterium]
MPHNPPLHDSPDVGLRGLAEPPVQYVLAPPIARHAVEPVVISDDNADPRPLWQRLRSRFGGDAASGGISLVVHTIGLIILALVAIANDDGPRGPEIVLGPIR